MTADADLVGQADIAMRRTPIGRAIYHYGLGLMRRQEPVVSSLMTRIQTFLVNEMLRGVLTPDVALAGIERAEAA